MLRHREHTVNRREDRYVEGEKGQTKIYWAREIHNWASPNHSHETNELSRMDLMQKKKRRLKELWVNNGYRCQECIDETQRSWRNASWTATTTITHGKNPLPTKTCLFPIIAMSDPPLWGWKVLPCVPQEHLQSLICPASDSLSCIAVSSEVSPWPGHGPPGLASPSKYPCLYCMW